MIHYLLFGADGKILQRGMCASKELIPPVPGARVEVIEPNDPRQPYKGPPPSYADHRRAEYPTVGEQMDMLWHGMDSGALPKVEPFYSRIKAVKDAHPKSPG